MTGFYEVLSSQQARLNMRSQHSNIVVLEAAHKKSSSVPRDERESSQ